MIYNNLHRIKGILSARLGALIPKFEFGAKFLINYKGSTLYSPDKELWFTDVLCTNHYSNIDDSFREAIESAQPIQLNGKVATTVIGSPAQDPNTSVKEASLFLKTVIDVAQQVAAKIQAEQQTNALLATPTITPLSTTSLNASEIDVSKGMNIVKLLLKRLADAAEAEAQEQRKIKDNKVTQATENITKITGLAIQSLGNAFGASQAATDSNLTKGIDSGVAVTGDVLSQFGGIAGGIGLILQIGSAAGQIIEGITGGTDLMTATDKFFDSGIGTVLGGWVNQLWGKNSDAFGVDLSMASTVGSSYGGSMDLLNEAARTADKKYGWFSSEARKKANEAISKAKLTLNLMSNVADTATDQRLAVQSMGEQAGLAYSMMTDGGYNLKYTYAAKHGGSLEWNPVIELEWQPQIDLNWELPSFKDGGSVEFVEELEWIPEFKDGGKTEDSDVPETEETNQKNVIPEGALHKNKHHMEHAEGLTKKGIPVVDDEGEQQAEIEHSEIIFTLEVTKKLEEYYEIFYSEESTNKEKEQAALDAGKLLVYQILENTEDRTGLIESCKKGGSLTLKKSTDDLIEEVLEWIPTIGVVETEEQEENKEEKPKKKLVDDSKEELKLMIKEVLVEMLIK